MRNTEYTLKKELPPHIRLEVYKEALEIVKKGQWVFGLTSFGLCLILPCVLWGLKHFMEDTPGGGEWGLRDTPKAFPELTEEWLFKIRGNKVRIAFLEESIKQLENDNNSITVLKPRKPPTLGASAGG
jgi:hypothetical protein